MKMVGEAETEEVVPQLPWGGEREVSSGWRGGEASRCLQDQGKPPVAHQCVEGDLSQAMRVRGLKNHRP